MNLKVSVGDRLVIGTRDSSTRDRLLRERPVPGLTRCVEALRASELSTKHKEQLKDGVSDAQKNTVHAADKQSPGNKKQSRRNRGHESMQSKQEKKPMQGNASSVASITLTIEPNVQRRVRLASNVAYMDTAAKCQEKTPVSSGPANKVHHTPGAPGYEEGGESACESVSDSDESIFATESVGVVSSNMDKSSFMIPLTVQTGYSPVIRTQLDTGATCSAMSYTDLLNILQSG